MTNILTEEQVARGPNYTRMRQYFAIANERYRIWKKRSEGKPQPWTDDPIYRRYRFCNVYREQDKVTQWIRENWRSGDKLYHRNIAFAMAVARLINWPPTLELIRFPYRWNPDKAVDIIKERQAIGIKVYTGAYLLGAIPQGASKAEYLIHGVLTPLYEKLQSEPIGDTLEEAWNWFNSQRGIGPFLAYEIVSDLRHTPVLNKASDIFTWANAGPGALRGLTRLWGYQPKIKRQKGYTFPKEHAVAAMNMLMKESHRRILREMPAWEMREAEHWLCEFDKYRRIMESQGVLDRFAPKGEDEW